MIFHTGIYGHKALLIFQIMMKCLDMSEMIFTELTYDDAYSMTERSIVSAVATHFNKDVMRRWDEFNRFNVVKDVFLDEFEQVCFDIIEFPGKPFTFSTLVDGVCKFRDKLADTGYDDYVFKKTTTIELWPCANSREFTRMKASRVFDAGRLEYRITLTWLDEFIRSLHELRDGKRPSFSWLKPSRNIISAEASKIKKEEAIKAAFSKYRAAMDELQESIEKFWKEKDDKIKQDIEIVSKEL